jgi:hypothetical protein
MKFTDQREAKSFFINKILNQAEYEGVNLSAAGRYMLQWSESDPFFVQNTKLNEQFEQEIALKGYEEKIQALIKCAYQRDVNLSPDAKDSYRDAYKILSKGDHYILVMIRGALGLKLNKWWPF